MFNADQFEIPIILFLGSEEQWEVALQVAKSSKFIKESHFKEFEDFRSKP